MTLRQLQQFKHWHLHHPRGAGIEMALCNLVLGAWLTGWMMLPAVMVLDAWAWLPVSLLLSWLPASYWQLRRDLHRRGLLRCDWLVALA